MEWRQSLDMQVSEKKTKQQHDAELKKTQELKEEEDLKKYWDNLSRAQQEEKMKRMEGFNQDPGNYSNSVH